MASLGQSPSNPNRNGLRRSSRLLAKAAAAAAVHNNKARDPTYNREDGTANPTILVLPNEILQLIGTFMDESSLAAMIQATHIMKDLLDKELYIKAASFVPRDCGSVLEWAAGKGELTPLQKVLKQMPVSTRGTVISDGITAAIRKNQAVTLTFLHRLPFCPPLPDDAVHLAAHSGSVYALKYLLQRGAMFVTPEIQEGVDMIEGRGGPSGDTGVAELLIRYGYDLGKQNWNGQTMLHELAIRGRTAHVRLLATRAPWLLNHQDHMGKTPLMYAIAAGQEHCAKRMVTCMEADVTLRDSRQITALHMAIRGTNTDLVQALISHGANVNASDSVGATPLHLVTDATRGRIREPRMAMVLLKAGAFSSPRDSHGNTPLSNALAAGHRELVNWLLVGAVHYACEFEKPQVLLDACFVGSMLIVNLYAQRAGFDVEAHEDRWKRSALHLAAAGRQPRILNYLLQTWKNVNRVDSAGRTALWYAARKSSLRCAVELMRAGASIDAADDYGRTPLMNFTYQIRDERYIASFVRISRTVGAVDKKKRTVLHQAARHGNLPATRAIVEHRPSLLHKRDLHQHSALMTALVHQRAEVAAYLREHLVLSRREFEWLRQNRYDKEVRQIRSGPEWARSRRAWAGEGRERRDVEG